jgi:hypothetical protein
MQKEKTDAINYIFVKLDNCRLFLIVEKKREQLMNQRVIAAWGAI